MSKKEMMQYAKSEARRNASNGTCPVFFRVTPKEYAQLLMQAWQTDGYLSEYMRRLVKEHLKETP